MPNDALKKIIEGNDIRNGSSIVSDSVGNIQSLSPELNSVANVDGLSGVLQTRFDDNNYYTA